MSENTVKIWYKNASRYGRVFTTNYPEDEQFAGDWIGPVMVPANLMDAVKRLQDITEGVDQVVAQKRKEAPDGR